MDRELELDALEEEETRLILYLRIPKRISNLVFRLKSALGAAIRAFFLEWRLLPLREDSSYLLEANRRALSRLLRAGDPRQQSGSHPYEELWSEEDDILFSAGAGLQVASIFSQYARRAFGDTAVDNLFGRIGLALAELEYESIDQESSE